METKSVLEIYKKQGFHSLNPEEKRVLLASLLEIYNKGKTVKEIGDDLDKSPHAIHELLKKVNGFIPRPVGQKPRGGDENILKRYNSGKTMEEIATDLNLSISTIHKILHRTDGFTPRPATHKQKEENTILNIPDTVFICPYCWATSGTCCPNDDYLEMSGYIYKSFLIGDDKTRREIIESEQNKKYQNLKEQSNIIRQLGGY